jgi:hypothetical protein
LEESSFAEPDAKLAVADHNSRFDNPLKKRYQVFVSSTYEDLVEERKHVMQALLATRCIPSGMELFPAANAEQWEVIKSVIDDCDYYVVIVAGKYGSIGKKGKSYTEMEFDYAVKMQKSILGFYFSDMPSLPAKKIELSDQRRTQLQQFTQKVKSRMCQGWTSPEGLASALKTAILHAMDTDPKSGWVRSSELPSWQMVKSLKERITELENKKLPKKMDERVSTGKEFFQFSATVTWYETIVISGAGHTELLRFISTLDLQIFGGYITLQLGLGSWMADHRPHALTAKIGVVIIDGTLALVAGKLLHKNFKRRTEVVETLGNINKVLHFNEVGAFSPDHSILSPTKFRPWLRWYIFAICVAYIGIFLLLFGGLTDNSEPPKIPFEVRLVP